MVSILYLFIWEAFEIFFEEYLYTHEICSGWDLSLSKVLLCLIHTSPHGLRECCTMFNFTYAWHGREFFTLSVRLRLSTFQVWAISRTRESTYWESSLLCFVFLRQRGFPEWPWGRIIFMWLNIPKKEETHKIKSKLPLYIVYLSWNEKLVWWLQSLPIYWIS